MKKIIIAGCVLIIAVAGIVFFTLSNLGPLIEKAVNTVGPTITRTEVSVADVSVSIFSGEAEIKSFFLGNPKGFKSDQAMRVESVYVDIDEKSITENPIVINKIEIIGPEITYEKIKGSDNFQTLLNTIKRSAASEEKQASADEDKAGKKIVINEVSVRDGKVHLTMTALAGKEITAPLPDIHLKDIGKEKQGATPAQAFQQIFASLYSSINADSVTRIFNDGLKKLGDLNLAELGGEGLKRGEETAQKAMNQASEGIKSATEGIKGLFNKK